MTVRSLSLSPLLLLSHVLLRPLALATSGIPGKVNLYEDWNCNHASTLNPTVTLPLSTCLVTPGGYGLVIGVYPPCPSSTASLIFYQDDSCGVTTKVSTALLADNCFQLAEGVTLYNARSVMFACQPAAANPQPSSTTTAVVSQLAAVATGSPSGNGSGNTTSVGGPEPTNTSTGGSSSSNPGSSTSTSSSSGSGLSTSDIIALAVGLGVGGLTITIMILAWLFPNLRHKVRSWWSSWWDHMAFPHHEQQQGGHVIMQEMHGRQPTQYQHYQYPYINQPQHHPMQFG